MSVPDPVPPEGLDQTTESSKEKREEKTEGDEEEEGECGFCLYMKAGGCRDAFVAWENCIEEAEKNKEDIVEKCFQVTGDLKKCMEAHADYYEPILRAEETQPKTQEQEATEKTETQKSESNTMAQKEVE